MKLSSIKVDSAKAENGAWVTDIHGFGDLALKVRAIDSRVARDVRAKAIAAIPADRRKNGLSAADQDAVNVTVAQDALLIDVHNLIGDDDAAIDVNAARAVLPDPDFSSLVGAITYAASVVAEKGKAELEEDVKN